jgi:peptidoglycan/LPS O-acetylase OafA/YrhL
LRYGLPFALFAWVWLLGFLYFSKKEENSVKMMLVGLGSLVLFLNPVSTGKTGRFTYFFSSLVLIYSPYVKLPKPLLNIFNYLGDISYPLYLFHIPTFIFSYSVLGIKDSISLVFLALLVSMLFYHAIDRPLRLKKSAFSTNVKQLLLDRLRES